MQVLDMKDIKDWDAKTIDAKVKEIRTELFNLRMQKTAAGIEKPHELRAGKKNIARLLTVKNAKR